MSYFLLWNENRKSEKTPFTYIDSGESNVLNNIFKAHCHFNFILFQSELQYLNEYGWFSSGTFCLCTSLLKEEENANISDLLSIRIFLNCYVQLQPKVVLHTHKFDYNMLSKILEIFVLNISVKKKFTNFAEIP